MPEAHESIAKRLLYVCRFWALSVSIWYCAATRIRSCSFGYWSVGSFTCDCLLNCSWRLTGVASEEMWIYAFCYWTSKEYWYMRYNAAIHMSSFVVSSYLGNHSIDWTWWRCLNVYSPSCD